MCPVAPPSSLFSPALCCDAAAQRLRAAFFQCGDVTAAHPARECLARCDVARLRDVLFSRGEWSARAYTRTLLLKGDAFNVMLLCWAPGCAWLGLGLGLGLGTVALALT